MTNLTKAILPAHEAAIKPADKHAPTNTHTKDDVEKALLDAHGIKSLACTYLECSYMQLDKLVKKYNLEQFGNDCKKRLLDKAEHVIFNALESENEQTRLRAAEQVLKSKWANEAGWSTNNTLQAAVMMTDGEKQSSILQIFGIQKPSELEK